MAPPHSLDEVRSLRDPQAQITAVQAYMQHGHTKLAEARELRDAAILRLLESGTPTEVARLIGMSVQHVKQVRATAKKQRGTK